MKKEVDTLKNKPEFTFDTIKRMEDLSWFTSAKIFDDLLIVAQRETNCFVYNTSAGLVVIDGIWPDKIVYENIVEAIIEAGWNPNDISKFVITHAHVDHTGCGKWLVQNHSVNTYLSKPDDEYWVNHPTKPDKPDTWKDFEITDYIDEGDIIDCSDKKIYVLNTKGHTPGCLSYIFPVHDMGVEHWAGIFGGATPPFDNTDGVKEHLISIGHFIDKCKEFKVDVALSNHTFIDCGLDRIEYSKKRLSYMPNIYILGENGFDNFCEVYKNLCE